MGREPRPEGCATRMAQTSIHNSHINNVSDRLEGKNIAADHPRGEGGPSQAGFKGDRPPNLAISGFDNASGCDWGLGHLS